MKKPAITYFCAAKLTCFPEMPEVTAEVLTIGDEILYGQITDTNTAYISSELSSIGVKTIRKTSVGDDPLRLLEALNEASRRADIVIMTGGLGPTKDDLTKHTLAGFFGVSLEIQPDALALVTDFFQRRGRELTELNRLQAALPANATYLPNLRGTAPGMWFSEKNTIFVSLPGVPHEMKGLMAEEVIPRLKQRFELPVIFHKIIRTVGIGESFLAEKIEAWENNLPKKIKLAYLPSMGMVKLRLTATGESESELQSSVNEEITKLSKIIPEHIFGYDTTEFEEAIAQLLLQTNQTLSIAESCTGGYLSGMISKIAGCSAYFEGSVVAYSYPAKETFLGVPHEILQTHGAVSEPTIRAMAEGVKNRFGTSIGLATSGIAGPGGGTPDKPVGTVWIALALPNETIAQKLQLGGNRQQNIHLAAITLLNLLRKELLKIPQQNKTP